MTQPSDTLSAASPQIVSPVSGAPAAASAPPVGVPAGGSPVREAAAALSDTLAADTCDAGACRFGPRADAAETGLLRLSFEADSLPLYRTTTVRSLGGYPGEPVGTAPRVEEISAGLCAFCLMVTLSVAAGSKRYLSQTITALRHATLMRRGALDENSYQRVAMSWLLVPVVAVAGSLLFLQWVRTAYPAAYAFCGVRFMAASGAVLTLGLLGLRRMLQYFAGYVFFSLTARRQWRRLQAPALLLLDVLLLSGYAACAHFQLAPEHLVVLLCVALLLADSLLMVRARHIFFNHPGGILHLFLYFCATEAAPFMMTGRLLQFALGALSAQTFVE